MFLVSVCMGYIHMWKKIIPDFKNQLFLVKFPVLGSVHKLSSHHELSGNPLKLTLQIQCSIWRVERAWAWGCIYDWGDQIHKGIKKKGSFSKSNVWALYCILIFRRFSFVCEYACMNLCIPHMCRYPQRTEGVGSPGIVLQEVVGHPTWVLRTISESFARSVRTLS